MPEHAIEVKKGERFEFGKNWSQFLTVLDDERIQEAEKSLRLMLGVSDLKGKSFLDIGSGSGLFSLAARRLGATVRSFDYDPNSVACTSELRHRYFDGDLEWTVSEGSVLDPEYVRSLGKFDIVYSWGVLHHTGKMWEALENASFPVADGGKLFIAIYNDQGSTSQRWTTVKRAYNRCPASLRPLILAPALLRLWGPTVMRDSLKLDPLRTWRSYTSMRGMSPWRDVVDWVGGYPFEVAKPEQILDFYRQRDYNLVKMTTCAGGIGCNQFVFDKGGMR